MEQLMHLESFTTGADWAARVWPQPSCLKLLGGGLDVEEARRSLDTEQGFVAYRRWFECVRAEAHRDAHRDSGFAWRRDPDASSSGTLLWCTGSDFEALMLARFEACALLQSACAAPSVEEALEMRAAAAAAFARAAVFSEYWTGGDVPRGVWAELRERHNRDCALLAATLTHATAACATDDIEARCGALAAAHASLAAHSDAHDPDSAPCIAVALACSVLALDTLTTNAERHLKAGGAAAARVCAERARDLLETVRIPETCADAISQRLEDVLYISTRVTSEITPFHARMLTPAIDLPKLY